MDDDATPIEEVEEDVEIIERPDEDNSAIPEPSIIVEPTKPIETVTPVQPTTSVVEVPVKKPGKKGSIFKPFFFILLTLMLMAAAAGATYLWRVKVANDLEKTQIVQISSLNNEITSLKSQLASAVATTKSFVGLCDDTVACTPKAPSTSTIENIKASITSGNTAALEGYMATDVTVILAATEAYGAQTPKQAVSDITSFISGAKAPWDFLLSASILSSYGKGGYGKYFTNIDTVGKSADGKVISFLFDCDAKISTVFMSSSDKLLN